MKLSSPQALKQSWQLILVIAEDWVSTRGTLRRFERQSDGNPWTAVGSVITVALGRTGMTWGDGIIIYDEVQEKKKEGDGKTPVGIYSLSAAYGYAPEEEARFIKLPYIHAHENLKAVDDPESRYYNRIVDERVVEKDWNSAEDMLREDPLYKWGIVIDSNTKPPIPGEGSCIFMHVWRTPDTPTAGCTAMSEGAIVKILEWLDPEKYPVIVQFPENIYRKIQKEFKLPFI